MKLRIGLCCLCGLTIVGLLVPPYSPAQDDADTKAATTEDPTKKPYDTDTSKLKPKTAAEVRAEELKQKAAKEQAELLFRLDNTVWNDLDLDAGSPGQVWMLRPPKQVGKRIERAWFLNDEKGLHRVGSWEVKEGKILLTAMNGSLVGRGTYDDDEEQISGKFIDADHHREYGQFRLREESQRRYRVLPMKRDELLRRRR